jgi:hypothetical protein
LILKINLGLAGLVMVAASLSGQSSELYAPARTLISMLPAVMCVGFASWVVYRLRCVRQAQNRVAGFVGAMCLGVVALSFGAAVGKLSMVCMTDGFRGAVEFAISSPLQKQAGLNSFLTFIEIGLVFGATFVLRAGKGEHAKTVSNETLRAKIGEIGQRVFRNWSRGLTCWSLTATVKLYCQESGCATEDASRVIDDWPEQRLRLQLELLTNQLPSSADSVATQPAAATLA